MPHDKNGEPLKAGDLVTVECEVTAVHTGEEYCNVNLETIEPMYPGQNKSSIVLNARQVTKVSSDVVRSAQAAELARG